MVEKKKLVNTDFDHQNYCFLYKYVLLDKMSLIEVFFFILKLHEKKILY